MVAGGAGSGGASGGGAKQSKLRGKLCFLNIVLQFLNSNILKNKTFNHLPAIFSYLDFFDEIFSAQDVLQLNGKDQQKYI